MLVKTVKVQIHKNQKSVIEKVIPTYEANLLKAIFGEENVTILADKTAPREVISAESEEQRLIGAYVKKHIEQLHGVNYTETLHRAINAAKAQMKFQTQE